jgi:flagellar protein FlgJ
VKVKAKFRVYSSYLEALSDYVGLLSRNPRYTAVTQAATAEQGAQALQNAGYATDPNYAQAHQHDPAAEIHGREGQQSL